ncbi:hypothetical protein H4R18_001314 [Coemansia javaensis]|uniref:Uncharacterized protein n=1 Tax=Coemansia javaensis TaxID=2761396 RepID=A0A9W8HK17_9FUNG|nr:hypothetical protein H4R18_001314 [Coemansia javaensis]
MERIQDREMDALGMPDVRNIRGSNLMFRDNIPSTIRTPAFVGLGMAVILDDQETANKAEDYERLEEMLEDNQPPF